MPGPHSVTVEVTPRQQRILEKLCRAKSTPQQLAARCKIILLSARGMRNQHQAEALGLRRLMVSRWRRRWAAQQARLEAAETGTDKDLQAVIVSLLGDAPRSGAPPKFTPEQVAAIIALACEPTADSSLPVSHWTPPELAREACKRGIVERISPRQVDRFLAQRAFGHTSHSIG
jgi:putative transposase